VVPQLAKKSRHFTKKRSGLSTSDRRRLRISVVDSSFFIQVSRCAAHGNAEFERKHKTLPCEMRKF